MTPTTSTASPHPVASREPAGGGPIIDNHSPNIRWGKQVLEVTLKSWAYAKTFTVRVGGNCHGFDIFDTAVGNVLLQLDEDAPNVTLTDDAGDTLLCEFDPEEEASRDPEDWLKRMVVSVRIVGWEPPSLNEIRKMNGGEPIVAGDVPYDPDGSFAERAKVLTARQALARATPSPGPSGADGAAAGGGA